MTTRIRFTTTTVNTITQPFEYFDATQNKARVWGSSALIQNPNAETVYVTCEVGSSQLNIDYCLRIGPFQEVTIPLPDAPETPDDTSVSFGAYKSGLKVHVVGVN